MRSLIESGLTRPTRPKAKPPTVEGVTALIDAACHLIELGRTGRTARGQALTEKTATLFVAHGVSDVQLAMLRARQHDLKLPPQVTAKAEKVLTKDNLATREACFKSTTSLPQAST